MENGSIWHHKLKVCGSDKAKNRIKCGFDKEMNMRLIIKGIELTKQERKALDAASDIIDTYISNLEYCCMDYEVIKIAQDANEIIDSIASGTFYDEYIEGDSVK